MNLIDNEDSRSEYSSADTETNNENHQETTTTLTPRMKAKIPEDAEDLEALSDYICTELSED